MLARRQGRSGTSVGLLFDLLAVHELDTVAKLPLAGVASLWQVYPLAAYASLWSKPLAARASLRKLPLAAFASPWQVYPLAA